MTHSYCLRYCYRYEPSFSVYSIWDIILYKDTEELDNSNYEIKRYLEKEELLIEKEDELQVFFRTHTFSKKEECSSVLFLKLVLFPSEKKEDSVVNLLFYPLEFSWDSLNTFEKNTFIDRIVKEQEKEIGLKYDVTEYSTEEIYVENVENNLDLDSSDIEEL